MLPESEGISNSEPSATSESVAGARPRRAPWWHGYHPIALTYKWARCVVVTIVGFSVLTVGIAMIVLPGPAFVVIPVGLGILSLEFAWARHWLHKVKEGTATVVQSVTRRRNGSLR